MPTRMIERHYRRRGMALMLALLVMVVTSTILVATLDTTTLQFTAHRNTLAWDRARYLAESGGQHALAELEADSQWRTAIPATEFPAGSGNTYTVSVVDGADGEILVTSTGVSGGVSRKVEITIEVQ